jgi:twitching motility protein PilU
MSVACLEQILSQMVSCSASDVYLTVGSPPAYRIEGTTRIFQDATLSPDDTELLAKEVIPEHQRDLFLTQMELNIPVHRDGIGRFRANLLRQRNTTALVIRRINSRIPSFDELDLPPILESIALSQRGLILIAGATGSGKSTTLAAMVHHRNLTSSGHIVTIEDPIEFVHEHRRSIVTQREVGIDTLSVESALKNCLRQAPDVIVVGEIRTLEAMDAALTFAETGHLCLATLHSTNTNQAMERVISFFPPERHRQIYLQLSLNLRAVISQRLVMTDTERRTPAVEILLDSPRVKDLIAKGEIYELKDAMEKGANMGMQTFDHALFNLYATGTISLDDALRNADSANNVRLRAKLSDDRKLTDNKPDKRDSLSRESSEVVSTAPKTDKVKFKLEK